MYETARETLMYRTVLWTLWERERVGRFGRMALKRVISCMKRKKKYFEINGEILEMNVCNGCTTL